MAQKGRSRSSLFLMEQIIVIAIFAFCAAVTVYIMAAAHQMSADAVDTRYALLMAENAAEAYKASAGDLQFVADLLGGNMHFNIECGTSPTQISPTWATDSRFDAVTIYYDALWLPTSSDDAVFVLMLKQFEREAGLAFAEVSVLRVRDDSTLVQFPTAVRHADRIITFLEYDGGAQ